jgi:hypothetical protein
MKVELRHYVPLVQPLAKHSGSEPSAFSLPPSFMPAAGGILRKKLLESLEA